MKTRTRHVLASNIHPRSENVGSIAYASRNAEHAPPNAVIVDGTSLAMLYVFEVEISAKLGEHLRRIIDDPRLHALIRAQQVQDRRKCLEDGGRGSQCVQAGSTPPVLPCDAMAGALW